MGQSFSGAPSPLLELRGEGLSAAVGFFPGEPDFFAFGRRIVAEAVGEVGRDALHLIVDREGFAAPAALE